MFDSEEDIKRVAGILKKLNCCVEAHTNHYYLAESILRDSTAHKDIARLKFKHSKFVKLLERAVEEVAQRDKRIRQLEMDLLEAQVMRTEEKT